MSENQLRSVTNQDKVLKSRSIALRTEKERSRKIVSKPHQQSSILVMVSTFSCSTNKVHDVIRDVESKKERKKERKTPEAMEK